MWRASCKRASRTACLAQEFLPLHPIRLWVDGPAILLRENQFHRVAGVWQREARATPPGSGAQSFFQLGGVVRAQGIGNAFPQFSGVCQTAKRHRKSLVDLCHSLPHRSSGCQIGCQSVEGLYRVADQGCEPG